MPGEKAMPEFEGSGQPENISELEVNEDPVIRKVPETYAGSEVFDSSKKTDTSGERSTFRSQNESGSAGLPRRKRKPSMSFLTALSVSN